MQYYRILNWCISSNERRFEFKSSLHKTKSNLLQLNNEPLVQILALVARKCRGIESFLYFNMARDGKTSSRFHFLLQIKVSFILYQWHPSTAITIGTSSKFCTNNYWTICLLSAQWSLIHSRWGIGDWKWILGNTSFHVRLLWQGQESDACPVGDSDSLEKFTVLEDLSITHWMSSI